MQIGGLSSFLNFKVRNKKTLTSSFSFVFYIMLSILFIIIDTQNIIKSDIIRSKTINVILHTKELVTSNIPEVNFIKFSFNSKEDLIFENKYLREELKKSDLYKLKSEKLEIENDILRKELALLPPIIENYILVKVTADTQTQYKKTIIVNAGNNMNVKKGDAALTSKGLIGSVIDVYDTYSRILLITDINSKIPVRIGEKNVKAIISGNNSDKVDILYLKDNVNLEESDLVYTSGDGGYFNSGIPIGNLAKENNSVFVEPFNDLSEIQYISVYINQFKNF